LALICWPYCVALASRLATALSQPGPEGNSETIDKITRPYGSMLNVVEGRHRIVSLGMVRTYSQKSRAAVNNDHRCDALVDDADKAHVWYKPTSYITIGKNLSSAFMAATAQQLAGAMNMFDGEYTVRGLR
jgi:hypothetical protein